MSIPKLSFTVEDVRTPEGIERVFQQVRVALNQLSAAPIQLAKQEKPSIADDLSEESLAELARILREQLQAPGAAPLNLQDLEGTASGGGSIIGGYGVTYFVGTLFPDLKPFLPLLYAYSAIYYATDFDHSYMWSGLTWLVMERTSGQVCWFTTAPDTNGWQLCDGSSGVRMSLKDGTTTTVTVPDLVTGNPYVRGGSVYSGPVATAAVVPLISGATNTGASGSHTHSVTATGSVTGDLPDHVHDINGGTGNPINRSDDAAWTVTGTVSSSADNGDLNPAATVTDPTIAGTIDANLIDCTTITYSGEFSADLQDCGHTHTFNLALNDPAVNGSWAHSHGITSGFTSTSAIHYHLIEETTDGVVDDPVALVLTFTGNSVSTSTGTPDTHTHTIGGITATTAGEPLHMTLLPYFRL